MKIAELVTGLRYMVTNEQRDFIRLLKEHDSISRYDLDERNQRLAEEMTKIGLINRIYNEETETVVYKLHTR
jgi:hypothetical protein